MAARSTALAWRKRSVSSCSAQPRSDSKASDASLALITWPWLRTRASSCWRSSVNAVLRSQRSRALMSAVVSTARSTSLACAASPTVGQVPGFTSVVQAQVVGEGGFFGPVIAGRPTRQQLRGQFVDADGTGRVFVGVVCRAAALREIRADAGPALWP